MIVNDPGKPSKLAAEISCLTDLLMHARKQIDLAAYEMAVKDVKIQKQAAEIARLVAQIAAAPSETSIEF